VSGEVTGLSDSLVEVSHQFRPYRFTSADAADSRMGPALAVEGT
jgi:hypothetical protein